MRNGGGIITTGKEIIDALKGKEDYQIEVDVKYLGRSVTVEDGDIDIDFIDEYKKGFLVLNAKRLNHGYSFDDGKPKEKITKKKMK